MEFFGVKLGNLDSCKVATFSGGATTPAAGIVGPAGICTGAVVLVVAGAAGWWFWKKHQKQGKISPTPPTQPNTTDNKPPTSSTDVK
jgi:hypothetical protein